MPVSCGARGVCNAANDWNSDGSTIRPTSVFTVLRQVAGQLQHGSSTFAQQEAVLAIARDVAQAAVIAGGGPSQATSKAIAGGGPSQATSKAIAGADQALLNGQPQKAVNLLRQAAG